MASSYLRRPAKPALESKARMAKRNTVNVAPSAVPPEITAEERAALAESLAYFCAACGRMHPSGGVRADDIQCAELEIAAVVSNVRLRN